MSQPVNSAEPRNRPRWLVLGGVAAAAVIATVVVIGITNDDDPGADVLTAGDSPLALPTLSTTELTAGPAIAAKCAAPTAADARRQSIAFEGIVTEIAAGVVTLAPTEFFVGEETALVTVAQPDQGMSEAPSEFIVGQTYIVGASDGQLAICGLTGPADDDLRGLYETAFGK